MSDTANKTKQFVVNTNEADKGIINTLKEELNLGDKGVVRLLIEIATNNRIGLADGVEVDTFAVLAKTLGLVKVKQEKVVLTPEEKLKATLERKLAKVQAKLAAQGVSVDGEAETTDEPETIVEVAV
jgi:hypothetical protein